MASKVEIEAAARSDAAFDGRTFDALGKSDKQRYLDRSEASLAAAREARMSVAPEREDGVDEILSLYTKFINDRPELLSLLYDADMLPEQTVTRAGAIRVAAICEAWRRGDDLANGNERLREQLLDAGKWLNGKPERSTCTASTLVELLDNINLALVSADAEGRGAERV